MQIKKTMTYKEAYLPSPRHRKQHYRQIEGEFTAEIQDVTAAQAPVVLKVHDLAPYGEGVQVIAYRRYNGQLYVPSLRHNYFNCQSDAECRKQVPATEIAEKIMVGNSYDLFANMVAEIYQENASRFLFIDGMAWEKASEPFYVVQTFGLGRNHGGTALMIDRIGHRADHFHTFSALQHEEAIATAVQVALDRGDTDYVSSIQDRQYYIEVIDPSAVQFQRQMYVFQIEQCVHRTINVKACNYAEALAIAHRLPSSYYEERHVSYGNYGKVEDAKKVYSEADLSRYKVEYSWLPESKNSTAETTATQEYLAGSAQNAVDQAREEHANLEGMRICRVWKENLDSWLAVNAWSDVDAWS